MDHIKSLQSISNADWVYLIEPLIVFDKFLRQDPAQIFDQMDFETREIYRKRIAFVARHSDCSESQVAQTALELAREGNKAEAPTRACIFAAHTSATTSLAKDFRSSPLVSAFIRVCVARACIRARQR